jgi:hypothetical protein
MNSENLSTPLTIDDLDQRSVPEPDWTPSLLRLRAKPIDELTHEELRLAIVNNWALLSLVPLALDILEKEPATGYGLGPRTLLEGLQGVPPFFWAAHPDWRTRAEGISSREVYASIKLPPAESSALTAARIADLCERLAMHYLPNVAAEGSDKIIRLEQRD